MDEWLEELRAGAQVLIGRPLVPDEEDAFRKYVELILRWQRVHRLIGVADARWITRQVLLDSLLFLCLLPASAQDILDFGAGAGVPGIPIRIVMPRLRMTLLEAKRRRASFLSTVARELKLADVEVIGARAEDVVDALRGRFDAVVMRCVGRPTEMLPLAARFVRVGGCVVASAGAGVTASPEAPQAAKSAEVVTVPGWAAGSSRTFLVRSC